MSVLILNQSGHLSECNRFKARFFLLVPIVTFRKVEKEDFFSTLFYLPTLNIICFIEKKIFLGAVCVFLRVTVLKVNFREILK